MAAHTSRTCFHRLMGHQALNPAHRDFQDLLSKSACASKHSALHAMRNTLLSIKDCVNFLTLAEAHTSLARPLRSINSGQV